jgi:hypothetical protein
MLSRTENFAKKLLQMSKYGYARLPDYLKERGPQVEKQNLLELNFENGSSIESMASRENAARGITASMIIADEWAFFNDPAEAWTAIYPATEVGGQIIGISTANGYGNWFHRFYNSAKAGTNNFTAMFFPWNSIPSRDQGWYEARTKDMEPWQLSQEYPATDEEAFIASGNPAFDTDMLKERIEILPPIFEGMLAEVDDGKYALVRVPESNLKVWEKPQPGMRYAIGGDVATGAQDGDFSTATVIKANTGQVVAVFRERIVPEDFSDTLALLGHYYNTALLCPERNTHGLVVVRRLSYEIKYPNLYVAVQDNIQRSATSKVGWHTNQASKMVLVDELGAALRRGKLILHCEETFTELLAFSRKTRSAGNTIYEGKPHDDLVISLGIANMALQQIYVPEEREPEPEGLTMAFFESLVDRANVHKANSKPYTAGYRAPKIDPGFVIYA